MLRFSKSMSKYVRILHLTITITHALCTKRNSINNFPYYSILKRINIILYSN